MTPMKIVFIVHYYPPVNSSGAKRVESISKYLARMGHSVTVITTSKKLSDGEFTEPIPLGVTLVELDRLGRDHPSRADEGTFEPMYTSAPSNLRRLKNVVMDLLGQLPDPRLPFALAFLSPWLAPRAKAALREADVVVGSTPPWPMLLAALVAKRRFGVPCILDYRDQLSECHEMPGGRLAKSLEKVVDRRLIRAADHVVTISDPMTTFYGRMTDAISTIMNGYDHEVMNAARARVESAPSGTIVIRYLGLVSPGRVPHRFLDALATLRRSAPEKFARLRVEFYGNAALIERELETRAAGIESAFRFFASVPYDRSMELVVSADYLLFCETSSRDTLSAQGILTTKLFEYIGSGRPVLADISPQTLAGSLLASCGPNHVVADRADTFLRALLEDGFYCRRPDTDSEATLRLSRAFQAQQYAAVAEAVRSRVLRG